MIRLSQKQDCCGCTACVQKCPKQSIRMEADEQGFLYPQINKNTCIDCGLCEKVCPVLNLNDKRVPLSTYAAINQDTDIRLKSSSGGMFYLLAKKIIEEGGVVFGAKFNDRWEVEHGYTETLDGLSLFMGSKYVQSSIGESIAKVLEFLKIGRAVLFSGTPCQIAGLRKFLGKEYAQLLTIDIVCHGVPSPKIWKDYVNDIPLRLKKTTKKNLVLSPLNEDPIVTGITFRNKYNGWKKYSFTAKGNVLTYQNSEPSSTCEMSFRECFTNNLFMKGFLANLYLRPSCYSCPANSGKSGSDITLGDFWGIQNVMPSMDDDKGTSLVMLNTEKGRQIFNTITCEKKEVSYSKALSGNLAIEQSPQKTQYVTDFWKCYSTEGLNAISLTINKMRPSQLARIKNRIHNIYRLIVKQLHSIIKIKTSPYTKNRK